MAKKIEERRRFLIGEIVEKLMRSARNGERLHLDPAHSRALISSRAYPILTEIQAEELQRLWDAEAARLDRA